MRNALRDLQSFVLASPASRIRSGAIAAAIVFTVAACLGTAEAQTVTVTASAGAGGTITPSGPITLPVGSNLTLTMTPDTGYHVNKLVVDGKNTPAAPSYTFENLTKNHKIAAKFKRNVYTLTAAASDGFRIKPSGTLQYPYGKVRKFKILLPAAGAIPYATVDGDPVLLTPAGSSFTFLLTVTDNHAVAVSAFTPSLPVTVEKSGAGSGTVTSDPAGIDCGATCAAAFTHGAAVTLTAVADDGSVFTEWSGACAGADPVCHVTVDAAVTAQAHFDLAVVDADFLAEPSAEPASGKAPLDVSLVPDADGSADPIAFYAWDDDGDGTWDSCDPDDPGNPSAPCDTLGVPREHIFGSVGTYHPSLLAQTTTGERSIGEALVTVEGTTSEEKILDALGAGTIDEETALTYRIYADFGDPRLPGEFAGDDPGAGAESGAIRELSASFDQLSPAAQDLLAPFLMPPAYQGSWYDLRTAGARAAATKPPIVNTRPVCSALSVGWSWAPAGNPSTKVRVWWDNFGSPGFSGAAAHIASEVNGVIWPKLTTLMGREPLADNIPAANGCFGDDGVLDIYLVAGVTVSGENTIGDCRIAAPGYIVARPNIEDGTVAHEVFHAFQDAFTLGACSVYDPYRWWAEASAQWAMDHVYHTPKGNRGLEQGPAPEYLKSTELSLGNRTNTRRAYGAYVFPLYLADNYTPTWIRDIWQTMEFDLVPPFDAFDSVLTGGLEHRWPEFARRAWNRAPFDQFRRWDRLAARAKAQHTAAVTPGGTPSTEYTMPVTLPPLSIVYYHYTFPDDTARTVTFVNGLTWKATKGPLPSGLGIYGDGYAMTSLSPADRKGGSVQVLLKIDGAWQTPFDLSDIPHVTWCRDSRAGRIEEAVFILANSDTALGRILKETDHASSLFVTNIGCYEWDGDAHITIPEDGTVKTELYLYDLKYTVFGNPIASPLAPATGPFNPFVRPFRLTEGSLTLTVSGTDSGGCTYDGQIAALSLPDGRIDTPQYLNLFTGLYAGVGYHSLQIAIARIPGETYDVTVCCPDPETGVHCSPQTRLFNTILFYDPLISGGNPLQPAGNRIEGTSAEIIGFPSGTGSWYFDAVREP